MVTERLTVRSVCSVGVLNEGLLHVFGRTEWDGASFHPTLGTQFKPYKLFTCRIFHLIFSDHVWWQVTNSRKAKPQIRGGLLYFYLRVESYKNDYKFLGSSISVTNASIAYSQQMSLFLVKTDTHSLSRT